MWESGYTVTALRENYDSHVLVVTSVSIRSIQLEGFVATYLVLFHGY